MCVFDGHSVTLIMLSADLEAAAKADTHAATPSTKSPKRNTDKGQGHAVGPWTDSADGTAHQEESAGQGHLIGPGGPGHLTEVEGQGQQRGAVQDHVREAGDPGEELFFCYTTFSLVVVTFYHTSIFILIEGKGVWNTMGCMFDVCGHIMAVITCMPTIKALLHFVLEKHENQSSVLEKKGTLQP